MDLEALLLGIEPAVALGVGVAALAMGPVIGALGNTEIGKNLSDSGRSLAKHGLKSGMETFEKIQETVAEAGETWNDIVAEAQQERKTERNGTNTPEPHSVTIE